MWRIVVVLAVAGCSHIAAFAQPQAIANHAVELRGGYAHVEVEHGGTVVVAAADLVDVTFPGDEQSHLWGLIKTGTPDRTEKLSVGTLVAGCGPDRPGGDCMANHVRGPIRIGTQRRLDPAQLGIGLFGALGAVGAKASARSTRTRISRTTGGDSSEWYLGEQARNRGSILAHRTRRRCRMACRRAA